MLGAGSVSGASCLGGSELHGARAPRVLGSREYKRVLGSATGLPPGSQCLFRVRAVNAVGEGPWSPPARFCTHSAPPDAPLALLAEVAPRLQPSTA